MNCDQPNHRTEFRFCVDITPLLVPTDPSGPKVKGWRSAVGEFVYNPARTSPTRRAAILQEHQSLLHDDANADTIVGHPTRPQSDSLGEWAGVDHANEREMAPDAVLGNVARWAGHRNIRLWRTVSLRKRVAWEFKDLSEILGELVRAQNPKWARKPGSRFSLYIEPFAKDNDVTANPPPSDGFKFRAGAAFVIVVVVLVILPGALIAPEIFNPMIMFFIIIGAGFFAALVSKIFEDLMLDARARLSCEYKVGCSVEEFMRRHGAAIMMAAREGRQGVVLKANADSAV
ncbi:hypothetical protein HK101_001734 [Irineochytrium annulatum]|nr:hypothetical protein HK101_001734 [Irineochytrium annulatum]